MKTLPETQLWYFRFKNKHYYCYSFLLASCFFMIGGCHFFDNKIPFISRQPQKTLADEAGQSSSDSSSHHHTVLNSTIRSSDFINQKVTGEPSPVKIYIVELKSLSAYKALDLLDFYNDPKQSLGESLLTLEEYIVAPSSEFAIDPKTLAAETRFVAVIVGFRQWEQGDWKSVMPVDNQIEISLSVDIADNSLTLTLTLSHSSLD